MTDHSPEGKYGQHTDLVDRLTDELDNVKASLYEGADQKQTWSDLRDAGIFLQDLIARASELKAKIGENLSELQADAQAERRLR